VKSGKSTIYQRACLHVTVFPLTFSFFAASASTMPLLLLLLLLLLPLWMLLLLLDPRHLLLFLGLLAAAASLFTPRAPLQSPAWGEPHGKLQILAQLRHLK
jgi:hypothetical protein